MPVKYQCEKCGRRFAEWGAEKLGFKCPQDDKCENLGEGEVPELIRVGHLNEKQGRKPSLKRTARKVRVAVVETENVDEPIDDEESEPEEFVEVVPVGADDDVVLPVADADDAVVEGVAVVEDDEVFEVDAEAAPLADADVVAEADWDEQ